MALKAIWQADPVWHNLNHVMYWLGKRAHSHTDWLYDFSKYVDIRFDSRTGKCLVKHDTMDTYLNFED